MTDELAARRLIARGTMSVADAARALGESQSRTARRIKSGRLRTASNGDPLAAAVIEIEVEQIAAEIRRMRTKGGHR